MVQPEKLGDWTLELITEYLSKGYYETDYFDFKERLPHPSDMGEKDRLAKSCSAFANSDGGFLIFGVSDDKSRTPEERLVGLQPLLDFPEHFGNYPLNCTPTVPWEFLNPPLKLDNGNVIQVVYIPKSWQAPHATKDKGAFNFPKRTNKGNESMSYEEIRMHFLQFYEKRLKLGLLQSELVGIHEVADSLIVPVEKRIDEVTLNTFRLDIIEDVISDVYTIFARDIPLLVKLTAIRANCNHINNKMVQFNFAATRDLDELARSNVNLIHNNFVSGLSEKIKEQALVAISLLEQYRN